MSVRYLWLRIVSMSSIPISKMRCFVILYADFIPKTQSRGRKETESHAISGIIIDEYYSKWFHLFFVCVCVCQGLDRYTIFDISAISIRRRMNT